MVNNSPPSGSPENADNLSAVLQFAMMKFLQKTDDMLPAKIIAYDASTNTASVQPLITVITTNNQIVNRAQVASVPVFQVSAGGFIIRFPIKPGDLGWIKANDRDISFFKQTNTMSPPNTQRKHSFEDAIFIPQTAWSNVSIDGGDTDNLVIQNYAGTVKISLSSDSIVIDAPASVTVNSPVAAVNSSTSVMINTPTATFTGDVVIDKTLNVNNSLSSSSPCTINGSVQATGDIVAGEGSADISLLNHVHGGVQTGAGNTAGPH